MAVNAAQLPQLCNMEREGQEGGAPSLRISALVSQNVQIPDSCIFIQLLANQRFASWLQA